MPQKRNERTLGALIAQVEGLAARQPGPKSAATNAQYARRSEPCDESCGDCRNGDRSSFGQCRVKILEHCHDAETWPARHSMTQNA
jgi:hypothetical protein